MSFEQYKKMVDAYKSNDNRLFESAAINWVENATKNPFEDKEIHLLFFKAQQYIRNWRRGSIDNRSAKRNAVECCRKIAAMNVGYPADLIEEEIQQEKDKQYKEALAKKMIEESKQKETVNEVPKEMESDDSRYVLLAMAKAYNKKNEINFKQFAIHFIDITKENPFSIETEEYNKFEEMKQAYSRHNMRRLFVVAEQLCEIINNTEIKEEPKKVVLENSKKVLGVPDDAKEEEKRSWLSFLNPWKKEGEQK